MSAVPKDVALDILALPSFASFEDIVFKYKVLAHSWYPEKHNNCSLALENFRRITESTICLLKNDLRVRDPMKLVDMYQVFYNIFFGGNDCSSDWETEDDSDEFASFASDMADASGDERVEKIDDEVAACNANQLILEEEQEKLKALRKKEKKKRRKARKKMQKIETESSEKQNSKEKIQTLPSSESKEKAKEIEESVSESEEGIDPDSAFVAVIAKKHRNLAILEPKKSEISRNSYLPNEIKEDPTSIVLRSRQLALRANEVASLGHFSEAINLFSESIKLDPTDHRFYGNRSYCFDRLGQFERALKDAEKSVTLCPSWPKGYYRKGRALLGLKKFAQAEECFVKVLKLDNDCEDAISELHKVRILQIMELGYSKQQAEIALAKHSSVQESVESLLSSGISKMKTTDEVEVFISDDESDGFWTHMAKPSQSPQYDIKMDPRNPENHNSLWIGNVQPEVTEKKLVTLFSKYGELLSVKVMPEKHCAFVNFKNKNAPGKAMQAYQGLELHGANLIIKFPNLPGETTVKKKPGASQEVPKPKSTAPADECYFWRTTGCIYGENCRNRHIKENKGIDKKKWHIVS